MTFEYQNDEGVEVNEKHNRFVYYIANPDWRNSITGLSLQKRKQVERLNPADHNLCLFFINGLFSCPYQQHDLIEHFQSDCLNVFYCEYPYLCFFSNLLRMSKKSLKQ